MWSCWHLNRVCELCLCRLPGCTAFCMGEGISVFFFTTVTLTVISRWKIKAEPRTHYLTVPMGQDAGTTHVPSFGGSQVCGRWQGSAPRGLWAWGWPLCRAAHTWRLVSSQWASERGRESASEMEGKVFLHFVLEVTSCHLCRILFVRSLGPAHTQEEEII